MKTIKRQLLCILFVVVMLSSIITIPSYAISSADFIRAKSWIATAITALNITLSPLNYAGSHAVQDAVDPLGIVNTIQEQDYAYYMDRSTIKIYPDVVSIDGQLYSDIWLSYDAANKFRTDGIDFYTAYSIASNSNGTYASGEGFVAGIPVYSITGSNNLYSQLYFAPGIGQYSIGDINVTTTYNSSSRNNYVATYPSQGGSISGSYVKDREGFRAKCDQNFNNGDFGVSDANYNLWSHLIISSQNCISSPFDFDYVSGSIPAEPLTQDQGLRIRVPSTHTNSTHPERSYDITDYVDDNPDIVDYTFNFDPLTNPDHYLNQYLNYSLD